MRRRTYIRVRSNIVGAPPPLRRIHTRKVQHTWSKLTCATSGCDLHYYDNRAVGLNDARWQDYFIVSRPDDEAATIRPMPTLSSPTTYHHHRMFSELVLEGSR